MGADAPNAGQLIALEMLLFLTRILLAFDKSGRGCLIVRARNSQKDFARTGDNFDMWYFSGIAVYVLILCFGYLVIRGSRELNDRRKMNMEGKPDRQSPSSLR